LLVNYIIYNFYNFVFKNYYYFYFYQILMAFNKLQVVWGCTCQLKNVRIEWICRFNIWLRKPVLNVSTEEVMTMSFENRSKSGVVRGKRKNESRLSWVFLGEIMKDDENSDSSNGDLILSFSVIATFCLLFYVHDSFNCQLLALKFHHAWNMNYNHTV
jgi:hypothetical protein